MILAYEIIASVNGKYVFSSIYVIKQPSEVVSTVIIFIL